ncbi:MAG TPA: DUF2207 domain-containing protein [Clostridiaceae bacterium]|nr:DUF2207 domain-containing protein [Clostridiaceae bacterium]
MEILKKFLIVLLISITVLFVPFTCPLTVSAAQKEFHVTDYQVYVVVNKDGSAIVYEFITYDFDGEFNGVFRDIDLSGTGGIEYARVFVENNEGRKDLRRDNSEKPGTYTFITEGVMAKLKAFEPSRNESKTFIFEYKLLDAVTKYNDIAEFNRKMIDTGWQVRLENICIKVIIPEGAGTEDIKVFAHGPLTGVSKILDKTTVEFTVPYVDPGTFVETRVLFPPAIVPDARKIIQKNALEEIMKMEAELAEEANRQREEARRYLQEQEEKRLKKEAMFRRLRPVGNILTAVLFVLWFFIITRIYLKYDKELKPSFQGKYYRELPGDYTPAEMSYLMSSGTLNPQDIMATLLDLIRKKQLVLSADKQRKKGLFGTKESYSYVVSKNDNAPDIKLKAHENFLIDWFINDIGDGQAVSLEEIKEYVKDRNNALHFKSKFDNWCAKAVSEAEKLNFIDNSTKKGTILGVIIGLIYLAAGILIIAFLYAPFAAALIVQGIILLIYSLTIKRRTAYGNEQYNMWLAFKRFLKDFSNLEKAQIPSIVLWEHYLVYAVSLGVAKEVIKQLPLVFTESDLNNTNLTFLYVGNYGRFSDFNNVFNNTFSSVENSITKAIEIANSVNSSASGAGGGFSGGSSGGSGGGGGGGAF